MSRWSPVYVPEIETGRHIKNNACAVEIKIKWTIRKHMTYENTYRDDNMAIWYINKSSKPTSIFYLHLLSDLIYIARSFYGRVYSCAILTNCRSHLYLNEIRPWYTSNVLTTLTTLIISLTLILSRKPMPFLGYNQCLSPLKLWVRTPFMVRCNRYNIMWQIMSVTCDRSVVFSWYSGFLHQYFKTDRHDITEILLKVALNTLPLPYPFLGQA
jgi:hypothetical protein